MKAERGRRVRALIFNLGVRGMSGLARATLTPEKKPGFHCTGGWVDPETGLDRCEKFPHHRDSIPGPSSP